MLETSKKNIDIREYWQIFTKRKFFFIIPFVLSIITGVVICIVYKPVYESSTVVQVSQGQMLSRGMQKLLPGVTPQERLNNLRRLITSHLYLKRLIETLNLGQDPKIRNLAEKKKTDFPDLSLDQIVELFWINLLREYLSIRQMGEDFIQISAEGNTPEFAFNLVRTLTQIFIDESLRLEVGGIRGALEFSSEQLAIYKNKLEEAEERLRKFKEEIVYDELDGRTIIAANMEQVNVMLTATDFDLKESKDRLQFVEAQIRERKIRYKSPNNNLLINLKSSLLDAIIELSKLMLKYSWQDVKVLKISSEIEELREKIGSQIEREIKSSHSFDEGVNIDLIVQKEIASMDVEFLKRKRDTLAELSQLFKNRATKGPSREMTLSRLEREVTANREIYQTLLQQTRGSEIEEALQKTSAEFKFRIVEPPFKPIKPIKPSRTRIIIMSIVLGAAIGFGLISLLEVTDRSFKKVEAVEKYLNLPVLGTMPHIDMDVSNRNLGK